MSVVACRASSDSSARREVREPGARGVRPTLAHFLRWRSRAAPCTKSRTLHVAFCVCDSRWRPVLVWNVWNVWKQVLPESASLGQLRVVCQMPAAKLCARTGAPPGDFANLQCPSLRRRQIDKYDGHHSHNMTFTTCIQHQSLQHHHHHYHHQLCHHCHRHLLNQQ